jgi:hypothetical protein
MQDLRICEIRGDEKAQEAGKNLHNKELLNLYSSPRYNSQIKKDEISKTWQHTQNRNITSRIETTRMTQAETGG